MPLWSPAPDARAAEWLVAGITTFAESVLSLVPDGYAAYCRIFHPALRLGRQSADREEVRWAEIARTTGAQSHAGMQLPAVAGSWRALHQALAGVYDQGPKEGELTTTAARELVDVLSGHTRTRRCWFGIWDGWGDVGDPRHAEIHTAPLFHLPRRNYHLMVGAIEAVADNIERGAGRTSPSIWWPDDRAWCVMTEIDFNTTYVGCSQSCCRDIVSSAALEAYAIDPTAGVTYDSDAVNPLPPRG